MHSSAPSPVDAPDAETEQASPLITVLTPTLNRAHTLHRLYESLLAQSTANFEWLIIDDGSTDGTGKQAEDWQRVAPFPVRYHWQPNAGKHGALHTGITMAQGTLLSIFDSDDALAPGSLRLIDEYWARLSAVDRDVLAGMCFLCTDERGQLTSPTFPKHGLICTALRMEYAFGVRGEWQGVLKTDVMRRYPFPKIDGERIQIEESVVWSRIAQRFPYIFYNDVIRIYYRHDGEPRLTGERRGATNALGKYLANMARLGAEADWVRHDPGRVWNYAVRAVRFGLVAGKPLSRQATEVDGWLARMIWLAAIPFGHRKYRRDRASGSLALEAASVSRDQPRST